MHKFYSTRGGTITLADDVSWSTNTGFSQINTPIWVSIDLNGHSHKTIQYSSIWKPCTKGMLGELDCALPHVPIRDAPTKNKNKHACCFCSRKLSSHWNSAAIAPIEILLNLCSAFASLKLGSDSPLALSPHLALAFILLWWNCPGQSKHPSSLQRWSSVMVEPLSSFRGNIKYPSSHRTPTETASSKNSRSGVHPAHRGNRKRNDDLSNLQSRPS